MTKQLLIYGKVEPVSSKRHQDLSVKLGENYEFARSINSVPLVAAEFPNAAMEYPIVFAGGAGNEIPIAILGLREGENRYVNARGEWTARYVPAFIRRYPFIFSSSDNAKTFTLCVDEEFPGCNREGRGERLFDAEGEQTQYLKNVLEFLKEYQVSYQRTEALTKKLKEMDLLEPMTAQFTGPDGIKGNLTGFMAIDREKLKALTGDQFRELAQTDELELIYVHIQSVRNFNSMLEASGVNALDKEDAGESNSQSGPGKKTKKKPASRKTSPGRKTA